MSRDCWRPSFKPSQSSVIPEEPILVISPEILDNLMHLNSNTFDYLTEMARCLSHWNCSDRRLTASPFTGLTVIQDSSRRYPTTAKGPRRPTPQWWITTMWLVTKSHVTGFHLRTPDTVIVSLKCHLSPEVKNYPSNFLCFLCRQVLCQRWSVCPPRALVGMGWQASS